MRGYLRRMRSQGTGVAEEFLDLLRTALAHYEVDSLEHTEALERAVLRMFAAEKEPANRHQLVMSMLRRLIASASSPKSVSSSAIALTFGNSGGGSSVNGWAPWKLLRISIVSMGARRSASVLEGVRTPDKSSWPRPSSP